MEDGRCCWACPLLKAHKGMRPDRTDDHVQAFAIIFFVSPVTAPLYIVLHPFQIVGRFDFFWYIEFVTYLDILDQDA